MLKYRVPWLSAYMGVSGEEFTSRLILVAGGIQLLVAVL